jgi:hypothetical protein
MMSRQPVTWEPIRTRPGRPRNRKQDRIPDAARSPAIDRTEARTSVRPLTLASI